MLVSGSVLQYIELNKDDSTTIWDVYMDLFHRVLCKHDGNSGQHEQWEEGLNGFVVFDCTISKGKQTADL